MKRTPVAAALAATLATLLLAGCGDGPSQPVTPDGPLVLEQAAETFTALPIRPGEQSERSVLRFVATKGQTITAIIPYRVTGKPFLTFRLAPRSLLTRPDGRLIADGDTITITITIPDPRRAMTVLEPEGITFHPDDPAVLEMDFSEVVRQGTRSQTGLLSLWRQDDPVAPWKRQPSALLNDSQRVQLRLAAFSRYAISY